MKNGKLWAYLGAAVGGTVSVAANVAHSFVPPDRTSSSWQPHFGAVVLAAFWPLALLLAVEVMARVAWPRELRWMLVRFVGVSPVAVVAAVVSYRHLSGLLDFYGEDGVTVALGPLAVDGLMVISTGALLALAARVRETAVVQEVEPVEVQEVQHTVLPMTQVPVTPSDPLTLPAPRADPAAETVALSLPASPAALTLVQDDVVAWIKEQLAEGARRAEILRDGVAKFGVSESTMKRRYDAARGSAQATA